MNKFKTSDIVKGVAVGMAVGAATAVVSKAMNNKAKTVKQTAGKALSAIGGMLSSMQG